MKDIFAWLNAYSSAVTAIAIIVLTATTIIYAWLMESLPSKTRRTGVYVLSDEERAAIADARKGGFTSDEEVAAFWRRHGIL